MASSPDPAEAPGDRGASTFNILFVCTGNTCRSPMAAGLARAALKERQWSHVEVESAGVAAPPGAPAAEHARQVMAELGQDLTGHRARLLTQELAEWADLVAVMGPGHARAVASLAGEGKVSLITDFLEGSGSGRPVPDPFGGDLELYRETRDRLRKAVDALLDRLEPILSP